MPDAVCVRAYEDRAEAQLARGVLEDTDIDSFLMDIETDESRGGARTPPGRYKLMVAPRDAARARSVLRGAIKF